MKDFDRIKNFQKIVVTTFLRSTMRSNRRNLNFIIMQEFSCNLKSQAEIDTQNLTALFVLVMCLAYSHVLTNG